jgi:glyoxylase-like metal-dependent hydrolase (beta-lactamase superfamily II)
MPRPPGYVERNRTGRVGRIPMPTPFPVGDVNAYLLLPSAPGDPVTLIDTGVKSPEAHEALRRGLKEYGVAIEQVARILVTHAHPDHYGQARRIVEASGATVYASPIEAARMRTGWSPRSHFREAAQGLFQRWGVPEEKLAGDRRPPDAALSILEPVGVDVEVQGGDAIGAEDFRLEVVDTPGHTEGHVVYFEPEMRWLFGGDHLLPNITPVPLLQIPEPGQAREKSLLRMIASLERAAAIPAECTFPSHGDVFPDHRKLVESYMLHHDRRALSFERLLEREGPLTPYEIGRAKFAKYVDRELFLVMSEVIGHLDLLEARGRVELVLEGDVERARLVH